MSLRKATRGCVYGMDPEMSLRDSLLARYVGGGCLYRVYIVLSSLIVLYISFSRITIRNRTRLFAFPLIAFTSDGL